jgi:EmrB/QacA subfamily drug resistance transporter
VSRLKGNPWVVLIALSLGFFMILLDTTIVTIAVPAISDGLNASLNDILWIQSGYVLVYAVLLITAGRLGDMFGGKTLFLVGLVIFVLSSAACGLARNPDQLIAARVVQGVGGALLSPQTLALISRIFPPERRGAAFGIWGAVAGVAAVAGPTVGGLLITYASWQWVFFLNVPIGVVAFALALYVLPNPRERRRHHFDIPGVLLVSASLFLITFGLIEGEHYHWGRIWSFVSIPLVIVAGVVLLILFMVLQYFEKDEPLVPFAILRDRNFSLMNVVAMALSFGMLGMFLPLSIYLQAVLRLDAFDAGVTLAPMSLVSLVVAPGIGRLVDRIGGKWILFVGLVLFAAGMAGILYASTVDSTRWDFLPGTLVAGVGMGCMFAPMTTLAMRNIPARLSGAASGVFNTTRQLGSVIGSAAVGALLSARLSSTLPAAARAHASAIPKPFQQKFIDGFEHIAGSGLQVGAKTDVKLPPGVPKQAADLLRKVGGDAFREGFVNAMRPTLVLPIAVLVLAALCCLLIKRQARTGAPPTNQQPADEPALAPQE